MAITTVQNELLAVNAISGTLIADNAITAAKIANGAVNASVLADGSVTASEIATDAETLTGTDTARVVTPANLAAKFADGTWTSYTTSTGKALVMGF